MRNLLWQHEPSKLLSWLIWTINIFHKINANSKCKAKLFAAAKLCSTYTICPISRSLHCSHSCPQYCCMGRQKSPYLFKTLKQTSPVGRSLAFQEAKYKSEVVLFQSQFLSSPLKLCEPSYFWNCSVTCCKICCDVGRKKMFVYKGKKKEKSTNEQTKEYNGNDENRTVKDLYWRPISELKISCSIKECATKRLWYILPVFFCA